MIEINLLPRKLQRKRITFPWSKLVNTVVLVVISLTILHAGLILAARSRNRVLASLREEWQVLEPQKRKAEAVIAETKSLKNKEAVIAETRGLDIIWSRKLNVISDLIPPEIRLRLVNLDRRARRIKPGSSGSLTGQQSLEKKYQEVLTISGLSVSSRPSEMLFPVGRFITALEKEPLFSNDFEEIKLSRAQREQIDEKEVMAFEIICLVKEKQDPANGAKEADDAL